MSEIFLKENLKFIRAAYSLSQPEMAERLGVTFKQYSSYEIGPTEPSLANISAFCCVLNLDADTLVRTNMVNTFQPIDIIKLALKPVKKPHPYSTTKKTAPPNTGGTSSADPQKN